MYVLFRDFHWTPMQFYAMGEGEKIVVRAFLAKYRQEQEKQAKDLGKLPGRRGKR